MIPTDASWRDRVTQWQRILDDALATGDRISDWQDLRWRLADRIGHLLTEGEPRVEGPAVYFVDIASATPLYIGETQDSRRRVRDLPVGESHHLSNTFPPEVWTGITVVLWPLLGSYERVRRQLSEEDHASVGRAVEYALQVRFSPLANMRRRVRGGTWAIRNLGTSRSEGARVAERLSVSIQEIAGAVAAEYESATTELTQRESVRRRVSRAVNPRAVLEGVLSS